MSAAPRVPFAGRRLAPVPVQRIAHVRGIRGGRTVLHCSPVRLRPRDESCDGSGWFSDPDGAQQAGEQAADWAGARRVAVLMAFAGRDGIKPQDPSAAANVIRK